jgi:osmotically-inducible protein OsmY
MPTSSNVAVASVKDRDRYLQHQVRQTLQGTGYAALQRIDCRVENGVVELLGEVPSFYCKQVAQAVVVAMSQIRHVENRLRVPRSP